MGFDHVNDTIETFNSDNNVATTNGTVFYYLRAFLLKDSSKLKDFIEVCIN